MREERKREKDKSEEEEEENRDWRHWVSNETGGSTAGR